MWSHDCNSRETKTKKCSSCMKVYQLSLPCEALKLFIGRPPQESTDVEWHPELSKFAVSSRDGYEFVGICDELHFDDLLEMFTLRLFQEVVT